MHKYIPGVVCNVEAYRVNKNGQITLVIVNDGYKMELFRPPEPMYTQGAIEKHYIGKNYWEL